MAGELTSGRPDQLTGTPSPYVHQQDPFQQAGILMVVNPTMATRKVLTTDLEIR
jgi:hypothetical protein